MSKVTVSTDLLFAVAQWSYKSTTPSDRTHLAVVAILGGELVSTDGHRMVRVPIQGADSVKLSVGREYLIAAVAAQRVLQHGVLENSSHERAISIEEMSGTERGLRLNLGPAQMLVPAGRIEDYPPIDRVIPDGNSKEPPDGYVFDPGYLAAISDVQKIMDHGVNRGVRLTRWGDRHGAVMFEGDGGSRYIIMPMRDTIGKKP